MSELLQDLDKRKALLKQMMLQLHKGTAPAAVRAQLIRMLGQVPYQDVVEVEQELISEGLPMEEILKFCDIHSQALRGTITLQGVRRVPPGHPVHTFKQENKALQNEVNTLNSLYPEIDRVAEEGLEELLFEIRQHFIALSDVEKHYSRKEHLLFPFLEKHGITGPSTVMWGKDDEARELLKAALDSLASGPITRGDASTLAELVLKPATAAIDEMIYKEEQILFPMALDTLTDEEWQTIYHQSPEIGFCLYDPEEKWEAAEQAAEAKIQGEKITLPTGSFTVSELEAMLKALPFDLTFVDKDDRVRFFSHGRERIFARSRAVLGRKVQLCHPPKSVHLVQQILDDFRAGRQSRAPFWINFKGRFVHIEYIALRDEAGEYLGTLEVTEDLTEKRRLEGEQRLLQYAKESGNGDHKENA
ncbi:MAG TPA: DUF438 domain-containing protein [Acidobacteriota bacterium]|nr:DUF438 domain-containing protein [Acidobacteriota bacterium]